MDHLQILAERYPGKEILPATVNLAPESLPCQACGGKTSAFIVKNGEPQTFERNNFLYVKLKVILICMGCETDSGITKLSHCLGREAP